MAERVPGRAPRGDEPPKSAPKEAPKPMGEEDTNHQDEGKNGEIDYPAELARLNGEIARRDDSDKKRNTAIRMLAATILTPATEPQQVEGRRRTIREQLLAIVGEIAPE